MAGRLVGYAMLEYTFFDNAFVSMVYVAEDERRQEVGRSLMQALASRCTTPKLFTSTNQSNEPMRQLLGRLGYVPSGIIHNLDEGDPQLVYLPGFAKADYLTQLSECHCHASAIALPRHREPFLRAAITTTPEEWHGSGGWQSVRV